MASFQWSGALTLWGLWIGWSLSPEPLPSFITACADSKQADRHCWGPRGLCHGSEAQDPILSWPISLCPPNCFPLNRNRIYGSMKRRDACLTRLYKPLQGGPCSYYDLRGIAITASALRQNERTTHSGEACVRAPVRNKPRKCVQWTSAPPGNKILTGEPFALLFQYPAVWIH